MHGGGQKLAAHFLGNPELSVLLGEHPHRCFTQRDLLEVESNLQPVDETRFCVLLYVGVLRLRELNRK